MASFLIFLLFFVASLGIRGTQEVVLGEHGHLTYAVKYEEGDAVYHLLNSSAGAVCDHFSYSDSRTDGPSKWGTICNGWAACAVGTRQSPINIATKKTTEKVGKLFSENYANATLVTVLNNGHTILSTPVGTQNVLRGGPLGNDFELVQYHYHAPSEHTVDGCRHPLELHLVHRNVSNTTQLAVIALFFEGGSAKSITLETLIKAIKTRKNFTEEGTSVDYQLPLHNELFPAAREPTYWSYQGSLTTPPCSEVVTWYVMEKPLGASTSQLGTLRDFIGRTGNARPIVPDPKPKRGSKPVERQVLHFISEKKSGQNHNSGWHGWW